MKHGSLCLKVLVKMRLLMQHLTESSRVRTLRKRLDPDCRSHLGFFTVLQLHKVTNIQLFCSALPTRMRHRDVLLNSKHTKSVKFPQIPSVTMLSREENEASLAWLLPGETLLRALQYLCFFHKLTVLCIINKSRLLPGIKIKFTDLWLLKSLYIFKVEASSYLSSLVPATIFLTS